MKKLKKVNPAWLKDRLKKRGEVEKPSGKAAVTNKTVEQHRDEVIGRAKKYIYPLKHSKRRIFWVSFSVILAAIIVFLGYSVLALYEFKSDSTFIYRVTQVIPFPIAKAGNSYVAYENYLFEVRHYVHYYQNRSQLPVDFNSQSGQDQLNHYKRQALQRVVDYAYVKKLAKEHHVSVSKQDVDQAVAIVRSRLGKNQQQLASVLQSFEGWSINDYRRELSQQILTEKVASALDTGAHAEAQKVEAELASGASFSDLAKQYSADKATQDSGGVFPELVASNNTDLPPRVVAAAFKLEKGQVSKVIDTGFSLEIIKVLDNQDGKLKLAHIQFNIAPISKFIDPLKKQDPPIYYISLPEN